MNSLIQNITLLPSPVDIIIKIYLQYLRIICKQQEFSIEKLLKIKLNLRNSFRKQISTNSRNILAKEISSLLNPKGLHLQPSLTITYHRMRMSFTKAGRYSLNLLQVTINTSLARLIISESMRKVSIDLIIKYRARYE